MRRDTLRAKYSARDCTAEGQRGSLPADEISGTKGRDPACVRRSNLRLAIQPAPDDPTCVHKAAKPRLIPVCTRSRSSFEHFFPNRPYFGGLFGKKCTKVASAVRGRRQTRPLGLPVCVCCVNCHDLVCLYRQRSVIFSLADFACKRSVNTYIAGWSSLVARRAHNPKVVGSNPAPATKNNRLNWKNSSGVFLFQGSKTGDRVGIRVGIRAHASIPVKSSAWKPFLSGGNFLQLCGSEFILCKTGDRSTPDVLAALKGRVLLWAGRYLQTRAAI